MHRRIDGGTRYLGHAGFSDCQRYNMQTNSGVATLDRWENLSLRGAEGKISQQFSRKRSVSVFIYGNEAG
jgi:hypothetical protein